MYKRDEQIAEHLRSLQDEFGWPNAFDVTTGKVNYDRILRIAARLKNRMNVTCSLQSLNPKTLEVIKRKNIPMNEYRQLQNEIKRRRMVSVGELIAPVPEETKTSFFEGVKAIANAGVELIVPYTTMLLKGTYINSRECREKYKMQTKFRLVPRQFGEYMGQKCFEIEEVCVATNTMSFEDYLESRGFALISSLLSHEQFDLITRHLKELGISNYDYLYHVWELVLSGKTQLSKIYDRYIEETKKELWDSKENLYEYFTKQQAYEKLQAGQLGDNLIRKYKAEILLKCCIPTIELAYSAIESIAHEGINKTVRQSLDAAKRWMIATRDISAVFQNDFSIDSSEMLHLPYDVNSWYLAGTSANPLVSYDTSTAYTIFYDAKELETILSEGQKLFGDDLTFRVGKLLVNWDVRNFWRKCKPMAKESSIC